MKKALSILMIFMLTFLTVNPLASVLAETIFIGTINGSVANQDGKGVINVSGAPNGAVLTLYRADNNTSYGATKTVNNQTATFENVDAGSYYVRSTVTVGSETVVSAPSQTIQVKPLAVTISIGNDDSTTINVNHGIPGATFTLYKDEDGTSPFIPRTATADANGNGKFELVPPGKNYRVKQTYNSVESDPSNQDITIRPSAVKVVPSADAGPSNNQGTLSVLESKSGNIIRLYYGNMNTLIDSKIADSQGGYTFTGLKAGKYFITQQENGAESSYVEVSIRDAQAPVITLNGPSEVRIIVGETYSDLGATATDNIDDSTTLTQKIEINNPVSPASLPGIYTITYNVTDNNGNKAIEVTRKVIIAPKKVVLTPVHTNAATNPTSKDGPNGQIQVDHVYSGAILYLYQDPNGVLIRTITDASSPGYTINNVPVGKDYYVIQEFHNANGTVVESEPSDRKEIRDTTKPVLTLTGNDPIELVMGDRYIEYGATATDNVDKPEEINPKVEITGSVNTNVPGTYIISYNVKDNAGNPATPITRTVNVSPTAVIAIGSTADLGEVGVKNAIPGALLKLYKRNDDDNINGNVYEYTLTQGETTYVFKNVPPGSYYVKQQAGGFWSTPSNVVDVVDTDRPYITLIGPEKMSFVWNIDKDEYSFNESTNKGNFKDPGAKAFDYIEKDLTSKIVKVTTPNIGNTDNLTITAPGSYTITYSVAAERGTEADDKHRTIIVAPPKLVEDENNPYTEAGKNDIKVSGAFNDTTTVINLYNTYNQLIESQAAVNQKADFKNVPAGLGYYVTQTVNGIESAPSEPVDVTVFEVAENAALITTFEFTDPKAVGVIDHEAGTIMVTVPKGTDVTNLKASITSIGNVTGGPYDGTKGQNFTNRVTYTVEPKDPTKGTHKNYTVTVKPSIFDSKLWSDTVKKEVTFSSTEKSSNLSPTEKAIATVNGVSFIAANRAIHVPAVNVQQANSATLTVSTPSTSSITQTMDPVWRTTINSATDIHWGNSTAPFLQPIEMEMPNPDKKVFAKLVRENGKLFAIVQPSKMVGDNILGLVTEPGTYALVTPIAAPRITSSTLNNETTYSISAPGAEIYYTTNSSEITFDRSKQNHNLNKRDSQLESYSLEKTLPDLSKWTLYTTGERISSPTGELYAFATKDQMISPLASEFAKTNVVWQKDIPTYSTHKVLKITFNSKVDLKALHSNTIYVKDDATGNIVETTLSLSADGKTISITPTKAYTANKQYTLYIERHMKGNTKDNEFLNDTLTRTFIVK